jgi:hypothetical protein
MVAKPSGWITEPVGNSRPDCYLIGRIGQSLSIVKASNILHKRVLDVGPG